MPQLLPTGTTQADSTDITLASGVSTVISLFAASGVSIPLEPQALIQRKGSNGIYRTLSGATGILSGSWLEIVIGGPGTFRVRKLASAVAVGVDRD